MSKLNRKIEYALIALKYMSNKYAGQRTTVKEICAATHIPFDATSRVMQQMAQKNILKAEHGAHGGYMLITDLSKLSFLEITQILSGNVEVVRCLGVDADCEFLGKCNVVSPLRVFNDKLIQFYKSLSIAEIIQVKELPREARVESP